MGPYFFNFHDATAPPPVGQAFLIFDTSRSHPDTPQWVGILWMSDQPVPETSTRHTHIHNTHNRQTSMAEAGFEPAIRASERPPTHTLRRADCGIGDALVLERVLVKF